MTEATSQTTVSQSETHAFDAEVHQLLKLMINALYSNREIFLRELISNASDAIDKLRFIALTDAELQASIQSPTIDVSFDVEGGELVIEDTGIGMTRDEVIENLGTLLHVHQTRRNRDAPDEARPIPREPPPVKDLSNIRSSI